MSGTQRVQQQPAWILHHRPFRDTSQILDVVTREHGKLALVARGSRGPRSKLAGVLRPFLPLRISWAARTDLGTLTGAEAAGPPTALRGDALLSAYYVNELVLHFLHRFDPQPEIFDLYSQTVGMLAEDDVAARLRRFEIDFLGLLGYAVILDHVAGTSEPLAPGQHYEYRMEQGPVPVERSTGPLVFRGEDLLAIGSGRLDDVAVLRAANRLMREVIAFHLGGKELRSRKVLLGLHRGRIAAPEEQESQE